MPDITAARPSSGASIESAWGTQVHDLVEGIQTGTGTLTMPAASSGSQAVVFPRAYVAPPIVLCMRTLGSGSSPKVMIWATAATTTGFTANASTTDITVSSAAVTFAWIAIGTPV